jgi:hypothetical protein
VRKGGKYNLEGNINPPACMEDAFPPNILILPKQSAANQFAFSRLRRLIARAVDLIAPSVYACTLYTACPVSNIWALFKIMAQSL